MPKRPGSNPKQQYVFFDVVYEDGSQRSNRRVPANLLGGLEKDEPARGYIIEQATVHECGCALSARTQQDTPLKRAA